MSFVTARFVVLGLFLTMIIGECTAYADPAAVDQPPSAAFAFTAASGTTATTSTTVLVWNTITDEDVLVPLPPASAYGFSWPLKG